MAFSEVLATRIRSVLSRRRGIEEKRMFGGIAFLLSGHVLVGVWKESLLVRVGPENYQQALQEPDVVEFDITGRPMTGWVLVRAAGVEEDQALRYWVSRAASVVRALPPK